MDQGFKKIYRYKKDVLNAFFPKARFKQSMIFANPEIVPTSFKGYISSDKLFDKTVYKYDGDGLFLHFTSFPVLSIILNSGYLRMSEFNCLDDKTELSFASKVLTQSNDKISNQIDKHKHKIFCLSACISNESTLKNEYMWTKYANQAKGCIIEYTFSSMDLYNFNFGKIQYGKIKLKPLADLKEASDKFDKFHQFKVQDLPLFLIRISAFHKATKFKKENEIRLLFFKDGSIGSDGNHLHEYQDFYKDSRVRSFIKIYLKGKNPHIPQPTINEKTALRFSPQIEIKRIILGPKVENIVETIIHIESLRNSSSQDFEIWRLNEKYELQKINFK